MPKPLRLPYHNQLPFSNSKCPGRIFPLRDGGWYCNWCDLAWSAAGWKQLFEGKKDDA